MYRYTNIKTSMTLCDDPIEPADYVLTNGQTTLLWSNIKDLAKTMPACNTILCKRNIQSIFLPNESVPIENTTPSSIISVTLFDTLVKKPLKQLGSLYPTFKKAYSKVDMTIEVKLPTKKVDQMKFANTIKSIERDFEAKTSTNNIYIWLNRILTDIHRDSMDTKVVSFVSLYNLNQWYRELYPLCVQEAITLLLNTIDPIKGSIEWKEDVIDDEFTKCRVFQPNIYVPEKFVKLQTMYSLHSHQVEFLKTFVATPSSTWHLLDWSTGSGKSVIVPAVLAASDYNFEGSSGVIHITQPLLLRQAAAVALSAHRSFAICDSVSTFIKSPSEGIDIGNENVSMIVTTPNAFVKLYSSKERPLNKTGYVFNEARSKFEHTVIIIDDLPIEDIDNVINHLSLYYMTNTYIIIMSATLREPIMSKYPNFKVHSHHSIYGFVDMKIDRLVNCTILNGIQPANGSHLISHADILRLINGNHEVARFLTPYLLKSIRQFLTKDCPTFALKDIATHKAFTDYMVNIIKNHWKHDICLTVVSEYDVKLSDLMSDITTELPLKTARGILVLCENDSRQNTINDWYASLYKTADWIQPLNDDLKTEAKFISEERTRLLNVHRQYELLINNENKLTTDQMNQLTAFRRNPETLSPPQSSLTKVPLRRFNRRHLYDSSNDHRLYMETLDTSTEATRLKQSGLGILDPHAPNAALLVTSDIRTGLLPFTLMFDGHCNGHNLDASGIVLGCHNKDITRQSIGRVGRLHHQYPGRVIPYDKKAFMHIVSMLSE